MNKILIIGISGAGKSTFAKKLSEKLTIQIIHLDQFFFEPGWIKVEKSLFEKKVLERIKTAQWIIDGNYTNSMELWIKDADTIFYFDFPVWRCLWSVICRRIIFHGQKRSDVAKGCNEVLNLKFLKFIWNFPKNNTPKIESILTKQPKEKKIVRFKNYKEIELFLKNIST